MDNSDIDKLLDDLIENFSRKRSGKLYCIYPRLCNQCRGKINFPRNSKQYECNECGRKRANERYAENPEKFKTKRKVRSLEQRQQVLLYYSVGDSITCACCGETRYEFMCLDHINGGGNIHRCKTDVGDGDGVYRWAKRNNFPEGFQVLCHNCNMAKSLYGRCPHESE